MIWRVVVSGLFVLSLGCSSSSSSEPVEQADGGADGAAPARDASAGDAHSGGSGTLTCDGFPTSGGDQNAGGAFQYLALQTTACACDTKSPFGTAAGKAGDPCTSYKDCAVSCCTCATSARAFGAAVCQGGKCLDESSACAAVSGVSFAMKSKCP